MVLVRVQHDLTQPAALCFVQLQGLDVTSAMNAAARVSPGKTSRGANGPANAQHREDWDMLVGDTRPWGGLLCRGRWEAVCYQDWYQPQKAVSSPLEGGREALATS